MKANIFLQTPFSQSQLLFLLATLLFLLPIISSHDPPNAKNNAAIDFIRKSCNSTKYPNLCFKSLSAYANSIGKNPDQKLAQISISDSLTKLRHGTSYIIRLSGQIKNSKSADPRVVKALNTCVEQYKNAAGQIEGAVKIMLHLDAEKKEERRYSMDDLDMNIALAIADELGACLSEWNEITDGTIKANVCHRTSKLQNFLSIARVLASNFAGTLPNPE